MLLIEGAQNVLNNSNWNFSMSHRIHHNKSVQNTTTFLWKSISTLEIHAETPQKTPDQCCCLLENVQTQKQKNFHLT